MSGAVIKAEGVAKRFRIGKHRAHDTLRDGLSEVAKRAFRARTRQSRKLSDDFVWALSDVSFDIQHGEVVGLIGANGAGKSTLLKILSRITEPTAGRIVITGTLGSLLEVGTGFHPELTGRENVFLSGAILGMPQSEIKRKFDEIVAFAEVEKFIDTPVKYYSSGMYVRLAFAVAAHLEPDILLVDEVLAVGDAAFQRKCIGKMGDAARQGRTVVFVSHNTAAIRSLCTRAILLSNGRVDFSGPVNESIDRYLTKGSDDLPARVEVTSWPRPSVVVEDSPLRITAVRLGDGVGQALVAGRHPIEIMMEFTVSTEVTGAVFGWSIHSSDQVRLFESRNAKAGTLGRLETGRYRITSVIPTNPLNDGLYTLHVGVRSAERALDYLPNALTFRVDSGERMESLWLEATSGFLRVDANWSDPNPCRPGAESEFPADGMPSDEDSPQDPHNLSRR